MRQTPYLDASNREQRLIARIIVADELARPAFEERLRICPSAPLGEVIDHGA